jgi:hypothetical protein
MSRVTLLVAFCVTATVVAVAQGGATGAISGKVQDASGAVVPSAEIRIVNQATGDLVRTLRSDDRGFFNAPLLPI